MTEEEQLHKIRDSFVAVEEECIGKKVRAERAACAELVRAAGCVCLDIEGRPSKPPVDQPRLHDRICPIALADAIEARGKE